MTVPPKRIGLVHVALDVLILSAVMLATTVALWGPTHLFLSSSVRLGAPIAVGVIGYLGWIGLYARVRHQRPLATVLAISKAVLAGAAVFSLAGFVADIGGGARAWVLIVAFGCWLGLVTHHGLRAKFFSSKRRVIVAGSPRRAQALARELVTDTQKRYEVIGFVVDQDIARIRDEVSQSALGAIEDLPTLADIYDVDEVVFSLNGMTGGKFAPHARMLSRQGIHVSLTGIGNIAPRRVGISHIADRPVIEIAPAVLSGWRMQAKRVVDVVIAALALVVLSPLMAAVAIAIRLVDGNSPLFRQDRVGKDFTVFTIFKFQTMVADAEKLKVDLRSDTDGPIFKMESDPRITKLGAVLRKTSIDELPQLFNVLRGDMSLVGPRPFLQSEIASASESFRERQIVTPGMTGQWQVSGRSDSDAVQLEELDRYYVDNWSLSQDLEILAKTVPAVLLQKGAR